MVYGMERYKLGDIDNEEFYILPKGLFTNPDINGIGLSAKVIYAVLRDRMSNSRKNGWHDDNGDIFFYYNQESLATDTCTSPKTVQRSINELKNVGLIDVKRQGLNKPNKLYINKMPLCPIKTGQNDLSETVNMTSQEKSNRPTSNTEYSNTKKSNTECSRRTLFFDTLPDGELKSALLEFRDSRKRAKKPTTDNIERRIYKDIVACFGDDIEAAVQQVGVSIKRGYLDVVYEDTKTKYLRSKQADNPRYNPMNPSGSRYTEEELNNLDLLF